MGLPGQQWLQFTFIPQHHKESMLRQPQSTPQLVLHRGLLHVLGARSPQKGHGCSIFG
jgi:hypothetical protein